MVIQSLFQRVCQSQFKIKVIGLPKLVTTQGLGGDFKISLEGSSKDATQHLVFSINTMRFVRILKVQPKKANQMQILLILKLRNEQIYWRKMTH